jgi:hypothetical protein
MSYPIISDDWNKSKNHGLKKAVKKRKRLILRILRKIEFANNLRNYR